MLHDFKASNQVVSICSVNELFGGTRGYAIAKSEVISAKLYRVRIEVKSKGIMSSCYKSFDEEAVEASDIQTLQFSAVPALNVLKGLAVIPLQQLAMVCREV
jgi:hypothetical protein